MTTACLPASGRIFVEMTAIDTSATEVLSAATVLIVLPPLNISGYVNVTVVDASESPLNITLVHALFLSPRCWQDGAISAMVQLLFALSVQLVFLFHFRPGAWFRSQYIFQDLSSRDLCVLRVRQGPTVLAVIGCGRFPVGAQTALNCCPSHVHHFFSGQFN